MNDINYWAVPDTVSFSDNKATSQISLQEAYIMYNLDNAVFLPNDVFKFYSSSSF